MIKVITFDKPNKKYVGRRHVVEYEFPFHVIDKEFIDTTLERNKTSFNSIVIDASQTLCACWDLAEDDLVKVLYEYGKQHIIQKLKDGTLSNKEELSLHTGNTEIPCIFEPDKIDKPENSKFEIEMPNEHIMSNDTLLQRASKIIDTRDNINTVFRDIYKEKLLTINEERDILQFFRNANSHEEFVYRLCSLSNTVKSMNLKLLKRLTQENSDKTISLLEKFLLSEKIHDDSLIQIFRNINRMRQHFPIHGDKTKGVLDSYRYFGIDYPLKDYKNAWIILMDNYLNALMILFKKIKDLRNNIIASQP